MDDFIYRASALLLLVLALGGLFLLAEIGHWFGRRSRPADPEHLRVQVGGIQGALLGLLALLLGFTFSMALDRFETRKNLVVEEANAIGTAALRARFLPAAERTEAMDLFRHYVAIRLDLGSRPNLPGSNREELNAATTRIQDRLWGMAAAALDADSRSEGAGLFAAAMNAMIDVKGENDAALANHVPPSVLILLYLVAGFSMSVVGYSNGLAGTRTLGATMILVLLLGLVILAIVDLDRPRRGLIQVRQTSLIELQRSLEGK